MADYITTPIPASPALDANSATRAASALVGTVSPQQGVLGLVGSTVYVTSTADPLVTIVATADTNWLIGGTAGLLSTWGPTFRVPLNAAGAGLSGTRGPQLTDDGLDHWLALQDPTPRNGAPYGCEFDFWRFKYNSAGFECASLTVWALNADRSCSFTKLAGGGTGAGLSMQGLVSVADLTVDTPILHAIFFACRNVSTGFRVPATKTDGTLTPSSTTIQEGSRVQLDPSINLDAISALNTGTATAKLQKRIAKALQVYGGYVTDRNGGANAGMSIGAESQDTTDNRCANPTAGSMWGFPGDQMRAGGSLDGVLPWDYYELPAIPWRTGSTPNVRVLANWNGLGSSGVPTVPLTVVRLATATMVRINWAAPTSDGGAAVTGYRVGRDGVDSTGAGVYSTFTGATANTYLFTKLLPATTYTVTVAAVNSTGDGPVASGTVTTAPNSMVPVSDVNIAGDTPSVGLVAWAMLDETVNSATDAVTVPVGNVLEVLMGPAPADMTGWTLTYAVNENVGSSSFTAQVYVSGTPVGPADTHTTPATNTVYTTAALTAGQAGLIPAGSTDVRVRISPA